MRRFHVWSRHQSSPNYFRCISLSSLTRTKLNKSEDKSRNNRFKSMQIKSNVRSSSVVCWFHCSAINFGRQHLDKPNKSIKATCTKNGLSTRCRICPSENQNKWNCELVMFMQHKQWSSEESGQKIVLTSFPHRLKSKHNTQALTSARDHWSDAQCIHSNTIKWPYLFKSYRVARCAKYLHTINHQDHSQRLARRIEGRANERKHFVLLSRWGKKNEFRKCQCSYMNSIDCFSVWCNVHRACIVLGYICSACFSAPFSGCLSPSHLLLPVDFLTSPTQSSSTQHTFIYSKQNETNERMGDDEIKRNSEKIPMSRHFRSPYVGHINTKREKSNKIKISIK